jgi:hypothetical protein
MIGALPPLPLYTRWFKYDRDYLCVNNSQFVPDIFEPPCIFVTCTGSTLYFVFTLLKINSA